MNSSPEEEFQIISFSSPEGENHIDIGCVDRYAIGKASLCLLNVDCWGGSCLKMLLLFLLAFASSSSHAIWFGSIASLEIFSCPWSCIQMSKSSWTNFYVWFIEYIYLFILSYTPGILIRHSFSAQMSYIIPLIIFFPLWKWKYGQEKSNPEKSTKCSL